MNLNDLHIDPLLKAEAFLKDALKEAKANLEKAGAIQAFEICYELAWKTMKRILTFRGIDVASPREVFRYAAQEKIIDNPEIWFEFIRKRNLTVHVYHREIAEEIFKFLPSFAQELKKLIETIQALKK